MTQKEDAIREFLQIPGINRQRAELLFSHGFRSLEDLRGQRPEELQKIQGIGKKTSERIYDYLEETDGHWYTGKHAEVNVCPVCGSLINGDEDTCPSCGVKLSAIESHDDEMDKELDELISDASKGNKEDITDHDGYWYKERKNGLFICPVCGSFVDEDARSCNNCGAIFEDGEEEIHEKTEENIDYWHKEKPSLFVCPVCGSFVSEDSDSCPNCGAIFEGEEGISPVPAGKDVEDAGQLFLCPNCGAFVDAGATACPNCGLVFDGEEEMEPDLPIEDEEEEDEELYVCPKCGNIRTGAGTCSVCGTELVAVSSLSQEERDLLESHRGFSICPECGAFVSNDAEVCPRCGAVFDVEETPLDEYEKEIPESEEELGHDEIENFMGDEEDKTEHRSITKDIMKRWSRVSEQEDEEPILEALKKDSSLEEKTVHKNDLRESIKYYDEILAKNPELAPAWEAKGELLAKAGHYPEAIEAFEKATELRPEMEEKYKRSILEILSKNNGNGSLKIDEDVNRESIEQALNRFQELLEIEPGNAKLWQITGELLEKLGRSEEALTAFDRAISLSSGRGESTDERKNTGAMQKTEKERNYARNGRTNGMVNGRRRTNGIKGRVNGLVNGNGRTNGMVNGRGRTNGIMGRVNGLVNGNGRTNGLTNGNGKTNGLVNGIGLVNGKGLINGNGLLDSHGRLLRRPPHKSDFWARNRSVIVAGIILVLLVPLLFNMFLVPAPGGFQVDGDFSEWNDIIGFRDASGDVSVPALDIQQVKAHMIGDTLALYASTESRIFDVSDAESVYFFIDSDNDSSTGYLMGENFGADYMVSIAGWNGVAQHSTLYIFNNSRDRNDWNGFTAQNSVPVANAGNEMETRFYLMQTTTPRIRAFAVNSTLTGDVCDADIVPDRVPLLLLQHSGSSAIVSRGEEFTPLVLDIRNGDRAVNITGLNITLGSGVNPKDLGEVRVLLDNGDLVQNAADIELGHGSFTGKEMHIDLAMQQIGANSMVRLYLVSSVSSSAKPGDSVSMSVTSVEGEGIAPTIRNQLSGGIYVDFAPEIRIDGSFGDWSQVPSNPDPSGDVVGPTGVFSRNIDIQDSRIYPASNISFYMRTDGKMLGGTDIPNLVNRTAPPAPQTIDTDGDTVPDINDTYPNDFNNDGILDSETTHDVDGDGIKDYPYGNDLWLNTTIPQDYPLPWRGRHISRYIGPVVRPELMGMDRLISYIDTDNNISTGNYINGIGADKMVLIAGRDGIVQNRSVYSFNSSLNFPWSFVSSDVEAAASYRQIEFSVPSSILGVSPGGNISVVTSAEDWLKDRDYQDNPILGQIMDSTEGTRADSVTKTLHLHAGDILNTTIGNSQTSTTIGDGSSHSWTQMPAFAEDFHVESATVSLYIGALDNFPVSPTVYVYLEDNGNIIGSASKAIDTTGWAVFDMGTIDYTIPAGNTTTFTVNIPNTIGRTGITLYYDSTDYDSRIDMQTDTYINVDYVKTYNGTTETDTFYPGDTVAINASVSDPFGSYDISGAKISITDPNGIAVVNNEYMNVSSSNESSLLFIYNYTLPLNATGGEYSISVTGIESNGVIAQASTSFIVPSYQGVLITPDSTSTASSDSFAAYDLVLKNIGEISDTYEITASQSSQYWRTELWYNGSEIAYDSDGDGTWDYVNAAFDYDSDGIPEFNLSSFESLNITVKKYVPASSNGVSDTTYIYATSETNSNVSDSAKLTTNVPSTSPTKSLHLHTGDTMDTFVGSSTTSTTIGNGETHTWIQSDPFYTDFNITSYMSVYLYLSPTSATGWRSGGAPDVTVSLFHNGTSIGSNTQTDLTGDGWYEFTIPVTDTVNILKGERISLNISVSSAAAGVGGSQGSADLYYDSADYDSRIVMPTDTYIDVESIKTYNSTAETQIFQQGENVHIVANISDPFGYNDISGANITIIDPDGNVSVHDEGMSFLSGNGANATFSFDFSTDNTSTPGGYTIYITGIESNGVTDTTESNFIIPPEYGVSVYPDQTKDGAPNDVVDFLFTVQNIGNMNDTYEISLSPSTHGWRSEIWNGTDEVAYDSDGDGVLDWVNSIYDSDGDGIPEFLIPSLEKISLTIKKTVPEDAGSVSDTTKLIATSETNSTLYDGAKATVNCPLPYPTKTLHFHSDDTLSTFQGTSTATLQIGNDESHTWTQNPEFAMDFNITSYIPVYLYMDPTAATGWRNQGNPDVTVEISYSGTVIGSNTLSDIAGAGWYTFTITPSSNITIPAGSAISINVAVSSAAAGTWGSAGYITLYYDSSDYDSRMETSTNTVVRVDEINTYNGTTPTSYFSSGDTVTVLSQVSDPFGAQDISGAQIYIVDPSGSAVVNWENMSLSSTDSATPPAWNKYSYNYSLPSDAPVGTYYIKVKGIESNGVVDYSDAEFYISSNMSIEPDNNGSASAGETISYDHWVNNTGKGADVYRFRLTSSNGFNVSLLSSNGDIMGYDSDGDGVWDYVNPTYDTDGDGIPDTGLMMPGDSKKVTVQIQIPAGTNSTTETTVITAESMHVSLSDSATDVTQIPEFSDIILPLGSVVLILLFKRRRNHRKQN